MCPGLLANMLIVRLNYKNPNKNYSCYKSTPAMPCKLLMTIITVCLCSSNVLSRLVQEEKVAVAKAKDFLESNTYSADDPYTTALSAYALALLRSPYAPLALRRLNHMAITQGTATLSLWRFVHSELSDLDNRCFTRWQAKARCWTQVYCHSKTNENL